MFLCPCCGDSYLVPLAYSEMILEERVRTGWTGAIAPARCVACQAPIARGDSVLIRKGSGVLDDGEIEELRAGSKATVVEISTWEGEGSIYLVQPPTGKAVYVTRAQLAPERAERA